MEEVERFREELHHPPATEGLDLALWRDAMIASFHRQHLGRAPVADPHPMASVLYHPPPPVQYSEFQDHAQEVRRAMLELPWVAHYGLSYRETMDLPVPVWRRMVEELEAHVKALVTAQSKNEGLPP